jgi:hypothetical protein
MANKNDWHKSQKRTTNSRFKPKWDKQTITWIINQVNLMVDYVHIQVQLMKDYRISARTAGNWIEMARRIMVDTNNGLSMDVAIDRDRERRNQFRRMSDRREDLSKDEVVKIKSLLGSGTAQVDIAKEFGIDTSTVSKIHTGKHHADVN